MDSILVAVRGFFAAVGSAAYAIIIILLFCWLLSKTTISYFRVTRRAKKVCANPCVQTAEDLYDRLSYMWCVGRYHPTFYARLRNAYMMVNETKEIPVEIKQKMKALYLKKGIGLPTTKIFS